MVNTFHGERYSVLGVHEDDEGFYVISEINTTKGEILLW